MLLGKGAIFGVLGLDKLGASRRVCACLGGFGCGVYCFGVKIRSNVKRKVGFQLEVVVWCAVLAPTTSIHKLEFSVGAVNEAWGSTVYSLPTSH